MVALRGLLVTLMCLCAGAARAQTIEAAQQAQLNQLRLKLANEIQLSAYNLLDEMAYGWTQSPVFQQPTDVVLAGVSVPVGLGTALQGLIENHLSAVLLKNPSTQLVLTHCPACTAVLVHSGKEGTIVSRGVDNPEALARFRDPERNTHALFVDIEAEGSWLVLRARLTKLDEQLTIVWSRTISSASDAPSMLRQPEGMKSVQQARQELTDAVQDRWPLTVPARLSVHLFKDAGSTGINPPPFVWLQAGVELALSQARLWTASFLLGYGYVPSSFDGFMAQFRLHRLVTGTSRSYTRPDLYFFLGGSVIAVWGPSALIFQRRQLTTEEIIAAAEGNSEPLQVIGAVQAGVELRVGNRLGFSVFAETLPAHLGADNLGTYLGFIHSLGTEVSVWF